MINESKITQKNNIFVEIILFAMVFSIGALLEYCILFIPQLICLNKLEENKSIIDLLMLMFDTGYMAKATDSFPQWYNIVMLFSTIGIIISTIIYCRLIGNFSFKSIGINKFHIFRRYIVGIFFGIVLLSMPVIINIYFNSMNIEKTKNIDLIFLTLVFIGYIIQGFSEEILCRGYFMTSLVRSFSVPVAVIVNSIVFALLHISNSGISLLAILNLFLFAVLLSFITLKQKSIWMAAAIHSAWNFTQGNFFGIRVSGIDSKSSVLSTESVSGRFLINGGSFGIEGSILVTVMLLAINSIFIVYFIIKSKKKLI